MDRLCGWHECERTLSDNVPENVRYCVPHQLKILRQRIDYPWSQYFSDDELSFILTHPDSVLVEELRIYLDLSQSIINHGIQNGRIRIIVKERNRRIQKTVVFGEMVRLISMVHYWVPVGQVARVYKVNSVLLEDFVRADLFGKWLIDLAGQVAIHRRWLDSDRFWPVYCQTYSEERNQEKAERSQSFEYEFCLSDLARVTKARQYAWSGWHVKGYFPGRRERNMVMVSDVDLRNFLLAVAKGMYPVDFTRIEGLFNLPFLQADSAFLSEVRTLAENRPKYNRRCIDIPEGYLCMSQIAEMTLAPISTVQYWLNHIIPAEKNGGWHRLVSWETFREFVSGVLRGAYPVKPDKVKACLTHRYFLDQLQNHARVSYPT